MGYSLYITRRKDARDDDGPSITVDEWKSLVESDPELDFKDDRIPLTATWSGKSQWPDPWFSYSERWGCIDTKNPDAPVVEKMLEMAEKLNARVLGQDGEIYTSSTEYYWEDEDESPPPDPRPWWKRFFRR